MGMGEKGWMVMEPEPEEGRGIEQKDRGLALSRVCRGLEHSSKDKRREERRKCEDERW